MVGGFFFLGLLRVRHALSLYTYLNHNALEVLAHRDAAQFDDEIAQLESRTLCFDLQSHISRLYIWFVGIVCVGLSIWVIYLGYLCLLLRCISWGHFQNEQIE